MEGEGEEGGSTDDVVGSSSSWWRRRPTRSWVFTSSVSHMGAASSLFALFPLIRSIRTGPNAGEAISEACLVSSRCSETVRSVSDVDRPKKVCLRKRRDASRDTLDCHVILLRPHSLLMKRLWSTKRAQRTFRGHVTHTPPFQKVRCIPLIQSLCTRKQDTLWRWKGFQPRKRSAGSYCSTSG